ncbi:MAG: hypothetical protein IKB49_00040 [Alphaproteobacteria bacterium]|nr:hypothetical protein [Alphaproteobacteria bacterium]
MKRIATFCLILAGFVGAVDAAAPAQRRGGSAQNAPEQSTQKTTAARAATGTRTAPRTTAARSATPAQRTTAARAATPQTTTAAKPVAARAATKQKVIGTGTKVTGAAKNIVVSEECQAKFDGCMDAFCMLDNETGGRCLCSDKNAELDDILAQIEHLDQQSYKMATVGVERLEMGDDADVAMAMAQQAADAVTEEMQKEEKQKQRKTLDLSMWDANFSFEDDSDIFAEEDEILMSLEGKEGDALYVAAADICSAQIPECKSDLNMLRMVYGQRIKSDCAAYENSLKQQKNASQQKLLAAEKALRETALEQYRSANKYDLGQCTVEFKKCMQTTGGCGDDFAGCASVVAMDNTNVTKSNSSGVKTYKIKGAATTIEISASTYDALAAKKPLCESVTKSCVNVAGQVWDTFLREVAPQIKSAELIAEDNARQNCIGNVSDCFQKACKEHMDPNDPDGSYDICLTRPETMLNFCKIPLNACGIDASSAAAAEASSIWDYVLARLASMRVDSCTQEVKECLQSDDRCGKDYTQCVGLDTDSIVRMCPYDKLVGCQRQYSGEGYAGQNAKTENEVYNELARLVQGIFLNIDNSMMELCQNAANEAMIKVCGDSTDCNELAIDDDVGTRSLDYRVCEYSIGADGLATYDVANCRSGMSAITDTELRNNTPYAGVLSGLIFWENVDYSEEVGQEGKLESIDTYLAKSGITISNTEKQRLESELGTLQNNIDNIIATIEADPTVQFCMTGREVQGMNTRVKDADGNEKTARQTIGGKDAGRFPQLTKQMRLTIAQAALQKARDNYYKKYDELNEKLEAEFANAGERVMKLMDEDAKSAHRDVARQACLALAYTSTTAIAPYTSDAGLGMSGVGGLSMYGATLVMPFTSGATELASAAQVAEKTSGLKLAAVSKSEEKFLKREVNTTFNWDTMVCRKCTKDIDCTKTKKPLFSKRYCADWAKPVEKCEDIQF